MSCSGKDAFSTVQLADRGLFNPVELICISVTIFDLKCPELGALAEKTAFEWDGWEVDSSRRYTHTGNIRILFLLFRLRDKMSGKATGDNSNFGGKIMIIIGDSPGSGGDFSKRILRGFPFA